MNYFQLIISQLKPALHLFSFILLLGICEDAIGQSNIAIADKGPAGKDINELRALYGHNKVYPAEFENQILIALSFYPELKDHRVDFQLRKGYAPLSSRPTYGGIFRNAKKRKYKVFISTGRKDKWDSILLKTAPFEAGVGVLGHELSHVLNFSRMSGLSLTGLGISHVSTKYMNRFEFLTDSLCIEQGMGNYLLAMSIYARKAFGAPDPEQLMVQGEKGNYRERYMSPATIRRYMADSKVNSMEAISGF
jgi:hypothetical protein